MRRVENSRASRAASTVSIGAIGVGVIVVSTMGVAVAANGGSLELGHKNTATPTTTLIDRKGTPLAVTGDKHRPPLTVNSAVQVPHLNAGLVGGMSSSQLQRHISGS
jgi:hypothetical protein